MNLVFIQKQDVAGPARNGNLLKSAFADELISRCIFNGWATTKLPRLCSRKTTFAIPEEPNIQHLAARHDIITCKESVSLSSCLPRRKARKAWVALSNGRFATQMNRELLDKVLAETQGHVVAVNADPGLLAYREKVVLTAEGKVAGFRRVYTDSVEPAPAPSDWPHHVFVRADAVDQILTDHVLPRSFAAFREMCNSAALRLLAIDVAGLAFDLDTNDGLLSFCMAYLSRNSVPKPQAQNSNRISPTSRLVGKVLLGTNVEIGPDAVVVGPTIICSDVKVEEGAAIDSSIILQGSAVQRNEFIQNCVVRETESGRKHPVSQLPCRSISLDKKERIKATFRTWPWFSYARTLKRGADILAAAIVLIMFAPVTPLIALAIKLTSPGPVFFKDKRQGLYARKFKCLKFRTMRLGAGEIQEKLRVISQVDGPQFKIEDDPRVSTVGRFLRDTYIDEIPQFINVLLGQMSVVGPRPSPESENTLCPWWRDARLSVRPGITGLWQVCRTRQPGKDFQEWIHYDTEYVKNLSLRMDLWICWRTAQKMVRSLIRQF
jgi:lipopolysaccharide/colanic/teichoic acid biosynthesis glycosyltransferase